MDLLNEAVSYVKKAFLPEEKPGERKRFEEQMRTGKFRPERIQGGALVLDPSSFFNPKSIAKGQTLEAIERLAKGQFKYHGNWAGPSYSAGRFFDKDEIITTDDIIRNPPTDPLDALTLKHDLRYQLAATRDTLEARRKGLRLADEDFIREAEELLNSQSMSAGLRAKTLAAVVAFKGKLKSDLGYKIDKLPNADEAKSVVMDYFNQVDPSELNFDSKRDIQSQEQVLKQFGTDEFGDDLVESLADQVTDQAIEEENEKITDDQPVSIESVNEVISAASEVNDDQMAWAALQLFY
jgi:hypothetical protein